MSPPIKKREVDMEEGSGSEDFSSENEEDDFTSQEMIQVDFEGRSPEDSDFHGIKQLLQQLFLKAHINLSELTDLIISQNFVGSVVKQSYGDDDVDEDEEDEDDDPNDVFGITTVVSLTEKQDLECISQLRSLLSELSKEHGIEQSNSMVQSILSDDSKPLGLIINERFINIPPKISVPLLESLSNEMRKAREKKNKFEFSYYIFICKLYKVEGKPLVGKKSKKKNILKNEPELFWSNPEEEIIDQEAECRFEFCVKGESDSGLGGKWTEDDDSMVPFRRVLIVSADKLPSIIDKIKLSVQ